MNDQKKHCDESRLIASDGTSLDEARESEAERFVRESGLLRRWTAQAMAIQLEEIFADEGLHLRRMKQRGGALKLKIAFPPGRQPSFKPKLGHALRAMIKRTGHIVLQFCYHVSANRRIVSLWVVPE